MAANDRSSYESANQVVKEALTALDPQVDFSIYDNDDDGDIDYICVFWSGPNTGWGAVHTNKGACNWIPLGAKFGGKHNLMPTPCKSPAQ